MATSVKERCFLGRKRRQKQWLIPNQLKRTKVQLGVHEVRITFTKPQIVTFLMVSNSFESTYIKWVKTVGKSFCESRTKLPNL